jgi:hypothetical protein
VRFGIWRRSCIHHAYSDTASLRGLGRAVLGCHGIWWRSRIHHVYSDTASLRGLGGCALLDFLGGWWSTRIRHDRNQISALRVLPFCVLVVRRKRNRTLGNQDNRIDGLSYC